MKTFATLIVLALLALKGYSTAVDARKMQARQATLDYFTLIGDGPTLPYPNYTISVPEDGIPVAITNPLVVYEIAPVDSEGNFLVNDDYNCVFVGADGAIHHIGPAQDVIPVRQVSVTCFGSSSTSSTASPTTSATISYGTKSFTTTASLTATGTGVHGNSSYPPYPTATWHPPKFGRVLLKRGGPRV